MTVHMGIPTKGDTIPNNCYKKLFVDAQFESYNKIHDCIMVKISLLSKKI